MLFFNIMSLQAVTGQLYLVDGVEQANDVVPGLLALGAPSRASNGRRHDTLFIHLTLSGPASETAGLSRTLMGKLSEDYFRESGSVTAGLRQVINETNGRLLQLNLSGDTTQREGAISCAILRGEELFVVQAGESLAFVGHNFGVERLPSKTPDQITPLGRSSGLDYRYYHQRLQPGDMLLLADPRIGHLPSHALSPALVDTELEYGLAELIDALGDESARLMLIEFTDDRRGNVSDTGVTQKASRISMAAATVAQPEEDTSEYAYASNPDESARQAMSSSARGVSRVTGWLADMMVRIRPPLSEEEGSSNWLVPAALAIIIPIVVAAIVGGVYVQRGRVRQVSDIRQEMSRQMLAAEEAQTDEEAILAYQQLLGLASEADSLRPGDSGVADLRRTAIRELDALEGTSRLSGQIFHAFGGEADVSALALRGDFNGGLYALESDGGFVYAFETDDSFTQLLGEGPQTIVFNEQAVGSHVVLDLVDLEWRPSGLQVTRDGLAILDGTGAMLSYYPNADELRATPLGLSSEWITPTDMAQFAERLYVLDPGAEVVWKYFPEQDSLSVSEGERTLALDAEIDLAGATDIDIYSEDGSLLVVYPDGRIRYYDTRTGDLQWDETDLLGGGLNAPMIRPVAAKLVGRGLNASIFILDAGRGQVIQVSRSGTVLAQYRATNASEEDLFLDGAGLAVAETPLRIFVSVDDKIYLATQE